jgi:hypothetical protein
LTIGNQNLAKPRFNSDKDRFGQPLSAFLCEMNKVDVVPPLAIKGRSRVHKADRWISVGKLRDDDGVNLV